MTLEKKRLIIVDSNSLIHRAYHALPPLTTKKGELVNAVYGFLLVFLKAIREFQPDFIAATFDFPSPTFRHEKYKEYKAKRPPVPRELYQQIPKVKEILKTFGVSIFEEKGFEADDIIGTISRLAPKKQVLPEIETIILSGDLDTLQLVNSRTRVYSLRKGVKDIILYDEKLVKEKFQGLKPEQLLDFKALRGDPSDNIPGVTGIGEKTAIELLLKFGSLENLYKEIEGKSEKASQLRPKLKEALLKYKDQAFFSKKLAQIEKNTPIDFNLKKCRWGEYDKKKVNQTLKNLEFYSLIKRLEDLPLPSGQVEAGGKKQKREKIKETLKLW
jgi:DNA polymerase-1